MSVRQLKATSQSLVAPVPVVSGASTPESAAAAGGSAGSEQAKVSAPSAAAAKVEKTCRMGGT